MSLESKIEDLTVVLSQLRDELQKLTSENLPVVVSEPAPPKEVKKAQPVETAPNGLGSLQPQMAPPPFELEAAVLAPAPFSDAAGLLAYANKKFTQLGPDSGPKFKTILTQMGSSDVSSLKSDQYALFYAKVEAL